MTAWLPFQSLDHSGEASGGKRRAALGCEHELGGRIAALLIGPIRLNNKANSHSGPIGHLWSDGPLFSMPSMRPNCICRVFSTKLSIVVHYFTHQLLD